MNGSYKFLLNRNIFSGTIDLLIAHQLDGKKSVGRIVFTELENGYAANPTLSIPMDDTAGLKNLAAELKLIGFVTDETAGELVATKRHLEDMRVLAKLKKKAE